MKFDDSPVTVSKKYIIQAIDPGAVNIGVVQTTGGDIEIMKQLYFATMNIEEVMQHVDSHINRNVVQIFEAPFFKTNPQTLGHTWLTIGKLWNPFAYHIFVTPQMGNKFLELDKASTHDIVKMNIAKINGWPFTTPHEVSAYAAMMAAIRKGKLVIE